jgi:hypothetical protein
MPAGEHEYLLNCCINDEPDRVFAVEVPKAASVIELRKAIWEENNHQFYDIDASSLTLWKVSIADEELDSKVDDIQGLVGGTKLRDLAQLSQVFSDPPKPGHLHIIVQRSVIVLNCWVLGDDSSRVFPVKIATTESVGTLKKLIKEEKERGFLRDVDASDLGLWKVRHQ